MNWHKFIFSQTASVRLKRHLLFWGIWWIYFAISYFHFQQTGLKPISFEKPGLPLLLKSIVLLGVHILSCYGFLYLLFVRNLLKAGYLATAVGLVALAWILIFATYAVHVYLFPVMDQWLQHKPNVRPKSVLWASMSAGLLSAPKVIATATAIKLVKQWYLKQKEKEKLEKEKLLMDLQLLKAQIRPEFLFSSLKKIYSYTLRKDQARASAFLLKLSELLSYTLYECENRLVLLEKDLKIISDYMTLQKVRMDDKLELDISIQGDPGKKMITPLLLLSFIEYGFSFIDECNPDTEWMNMELKMENDEIQLKLIHGKSPDAEYEPMREKIMEDVIKRLDFYYPGRYELKQTKEPEMMMTVLQIRLVESASDDLPRVKIQNELYAVV